MGAHDLRRILRVAADELREALYPPVCWLCRSAPAHDGLGCVEHALGSAAFDPAEARCEGCAARLPRGIARGLCASCRRTPRGYRRLFAYGAYPLKSERRASALREWILALKHGGRAELARPLGRLLAGVWENRAPPGGTGGAGGAAEDALLCPVPLHPLRRLERGYDQALLLARAVAAETGLEHAPLLRRTRWTPPQGEPGARSRAANVRDAFRIVERRRLRARGRAIVLVDDVVTSGATVASCAGVLRASGAAEVFVLALARVERHEEHAGEPDTLAAPISGEERA